VRGKGHWLEYWHGKLLSTRLFTIKLFRLFMKRLVLMCLILIYGIYYLENLQLRDAIIARTLFLFLSALVYAYRRPFGNGDTSALIKVTPNDPIVSATRISVQQLLVPQEVGHPAVTFLHAEATHSSR
jgi:hypothetical protein